MQFFVLQIVVLYTCDFHFKNCKISVTLMRGPVWLLSKRLKQTLICTKQILLPKLFYINLNKITKYSFPTERHYVFCSGQSHTILFIRGDHSVLKNCPCMGSFSRFPSSSWQIILHIREVWLPNKMCRRHNLCKGHWQPLCAQVSVFYPSFSLHFLLNIANISISLRFFVFIVKVSLSSVEKKMKFLFLINKGKSIPLTN